jgi:hypothetical protein
MTKHAMLVLSPLCAATTEAGSSMSMCISVLNGSFALVLCPYQEMTRVIVSSQPDLAAVDCTTYLSVG